MTANTSKQSDKAPRRHRKHEKKTLIESVLSPHNCSFIQRTTIQRTPNKLCTLNLPSPLPSLFDDTYTSVDSNPTSPKARHRRAPSDLNSVTVSVDPSVVTESSHPHRHSGASIVSSPGIPSHLRIGMSCDPLIAFDLVLVATTDGRVAVYRIVDYELEFDEDVMASERRRLLEWEEEDMEYSDTHEESKSPEDSFGFDESGDAIERMSRRERSRESVEPLVVVSLPFHNAVDAVSPKDDDTRVDFQSNAPMIVGMCATPEDVNLIRSHENCPKALLGHLAVLTDDGGVHILEFTSTDSSMIEERSIIHADAPIVTEIYSFQSSHQGATCICMHPMGRDARKTNAIERIRLCIGHECGVLECYQLIASQSRPESCELESPYSLTKSKSNEVPRSNSNSTLTIETPTRNASFLSAHLAVDKEDGNSNDSFDSSTKLFRTYSEPASRQQKQGNDMADSTIHSITAELCWRGSINVPIRSMTCPGWSTSFVNKKVQSLISIGLVQRSSEENRMYGADRTRFRGTNQDLPPAMSLEVIDASLAQEHWQKQLIEYKSETTTNNQPPAILLSECSVWPQAGMEVRDGWTRRKEKVRQNLLKSVSIIINKMCKLFFQ